MSVVWTLQYDATTKTFAEWGLSNVVRRRVNQGVDRVTFRHDGADFDGTPLFPWGASIQIFRDGVKWFDGRVDRIPRYGSRSAEGLQYVIAGPWWYLEHLEYQQGWNVNNGTGVTKLNKTRVLLFETITGTKTNVGQQLADVFDWAIAAGKPLAYDNTNWPQANPTVDEALDLMCAEVIRRCLRWAPDAVTWFDYSTTPPTFHIGQRANLPAVDLTLGSADYQIDNLQITSRDDLQVPAVILKFERTDTVNGVPYLQMVTQKAPNDAVTETVDNALVATIELEGATRSDVFASVEVETPDTSSSAWWMTKEPWLADQRIVIDSVTEWNRTSSLPRILTRGQIAPWMTNNSGVAIQSAADTLSARIKYSVYAAKDHKTLLAQYDKVMAFNAVATDAISTTYRAVQSASDGETVPIGLAQFLYDATSALQWDGSLSITQEDVGASISVEIGNTINITNGNAAWAAMAALVQDVVDDVDHGTTQVTFGPPGHLGAKDIIDLLRVNRFRRVYINPATRITGQSYGSTSVQLGSDTAKASPSAGEMQPRGLVVGDISNGNLGQISLETSKLAASLNDGSKPDIRPRWTKVCNNGTENYCLVMRSAAVAKLPAGAVED